MYCNHIIFYVLTLGEQNATEFGVTQSLRGIRGTKVSYETVGGETIEGVEITEPKALISPSITVENETTHELVLTQSLLNWAFWEDKGNWRMPQQLKGIFLDVDGRGIRSDMVFRYWELWKGERFEIDPLTTTQKILNKYDDTYEEEYLGAFAHRPTANDLKFGKSAPVCGQVKKWRTYLRWSICIPVGSNITSAKVSVCAYDPPGSGTFDAFIMVIWLADCPEFRESLKTWQLGQVGLDLWWNINQIWTENEYYTSNCDFKSYLQSWIELDDYEPGNHFGISIREGNAEDGEYRQGWQYDVGGAAKAAKLIVEFEAPSETFAEPIKNWSFEDGSAWTVSGGSNSTSTLYYMHGKRSWYISGSSGSDCVIEQSLSPDVVNYIRNRKTGQKRGVAFSFWYRPDSVQSDGEKNKAYAQIYYKAGGSWQSPVSGDTVKPTEAGKWCMAQVNESLPTNTEAVKVRIIGKPYGGVGFKGCIDLASLSVYYYEMDIGAYGNATLVTNIYYSNAIPAAPEWDGFVSAGFGIAAEAKDQYSVGQLKDLTVELLPNNGSATTQDGRLVILYLTQENSKNWTIRDLPLTLVNIGFDTGQLATNFAWWAVGATCTTALSIIAGPTPWVIAGSLIITAGLTTLKSSIRRVSLEHPLAEGGISYKVYETLDYSGRLGAFQNDRISDASAQYYFDWRFRTTTDDVFAIRVSATVEWWHWNPYLPPSGQWEYAGETTLSFGISLANYWQ